MVPMLSVVNAPVPAPVHACLSTLVIRTVVVDRNVYKMPIAIDHVPASTTNARIPAPVPVASMLNVAY